MFLGVPKINSSALIKKLYVLIISCQDTHVFRDTNCTQLRQLGIVQKLAFCLKNEADQDANQELIPMTIDIFSALVGSPPDLGVINALIQVALFLMESTSSYIHHTRNRYLSLCSFRIKMDENGSQESHIDFYAQCNSLKA